MLERKKKVEIHLKAAKWENYYRKSFHKTAINLRLQAEGEKKVFTTFSRSLPHLFCHAKLLVLLRFESKKFCFSDFSLQYNFQYILLLSRSWAGFHGVYLGCGKIGTRWKWNGQVHMIRNWSFYVFVISSAVLNNFDSNFKVLKVLTNFLSKFWICFWFFLLRIERK